MRLFSGDELGNIKTIRCLRGDDAIWKFEEPVVYSTLEETNGSPQKIEKILATNEGGQTLLATARSDGYITSFIPNEGERLLKVQQFQELRYKLQHKFVGLESSAGCLFWCTSNGALGKTAFTAPDAQEDSIQKASLPVGLCAWHLSADGATFAYGGEEVDLSVWDLQRTFGQIAGSSNSASAKKRSRGVDLLPCELWRAKNVPNDSLNLRQPIHVTSLTYLRPVGSNNHLVSGTAAGHVRRYDTRVGRRAVHDWRNIAKIGGVKLVEGGNQENLLFVADHGCNLFALDARNGRTIYSYKKISGEVVSIAPGADDLLLSTSRDRFLRIHSAYPPPEQEGAQQDKKGQVLASLFMKATPTAIVWDPLETNAEPDTTSVDEDIQDEELWAGMQETEDSDSEAKRTKRKKQKSK